MRRARTGVAAAAVAMVSLGFAGNAAAANSTPHQPTTPIKHFVYLLQENHTFDNYFGTRPGVDGIPPNTCMPVRPPAAKPCVKPFHIGASGSTDLDHSAIAFKKQFDHGKMDGFVKTDGPTRGRLVMGYYNRSDLPYY